MNKKWLMVLLYLGVLGVSMAYASDISDKLNAVTSATQETLNAGQKTSQMGLKAFFGWVPLVIMLVGFVGTAMAKYEEVKQNRKGTLAVLGWGMVGAVGGTIIGFVIVYFIGLLTMGGSEALDASATYWTASV